MQIVNRLLWIVAPLAGAWIETISLKPVCNIKTSHPSRVRGLKHPGEIGQAEVLKSHPSRVRGLKLCFGASPSSADVAPLAGAWIETKVKALPGSHSEVAPLAGAWIETSGLWLPWSGLSRTPRGCVD